MNACSFPACPAEATTRNRADQHVCRTHAPVVVTGSWVAGAEKEE